MTDECVNCGSTQTIPVWEDPEDHGEAQPDYVGCTSCSTMVRPHLLPEDEENYGQRSLTAYELQRLRTGNQHSDELSVIEWQVVKAAAEYHGIQDWTAKVDASLTMDENVGLMERYSTQGGGATLREMKSPFEYKAR